MYKGVSSWFQACDAAEEHRISRIPREVERNSIKRLGIEDEKGFEGVNPLRDVWAHRRKLSNYTRKIVSCSNKSIIAWSTTSLFPVSNKLKLKVLLNIKFYFIYQIFKRNKTIYWVLLSPRNNKFQQENIYPFLVKS